MKERNNQLSPLEGAFLKASQNVKKRERLNWIAIAGVGVVLLLMVILGITGKLNRFIYRPVDMEDYWVTIPAGEFQMGSENGDDNEKPVHTVKVDEFEIGKYEVTNRQYVQCVKAGICSSPVNKIYTAQGYELHPVTDVSWYDANTYCGWVGGRLPTEAEWEKAARGGLEGKTYPWGDENPTCLAGAPNGANFGGEGCPGGTMSVGSFAPNGYGLYDMADNVWEWGSSLYQPYPYDANDGREDMSSFDSRVIRGGGFFFNYSNYHSASRGGGSLSDSSGFIGFRCSRSLP